MVSLTLNGTCNSTLDDLRIEGEELPIVGSLTFHSLGLIIAAACALIAILLSLYLIWMHALHYTKPNEQRHIIRILFMIPVYAASAFLSFWFYWHAIYFQVISDCYEAFAIASFFALLCHYIAPNLREQKQYFRSIEPKPWVWPVNWFQKCCCGQRGPWRTPRSGLTWFNIIWTGIYQYCFIRVAMTITAVVTQYFGRYCESSNSPLFGHIWILVIEGAAVTVAMYCVIQFYVQLRQDLSAYSPFLKVLAIKLVIFLSFWQSFLISILTSSTFNVVKPNSKVAYPDLKVGVPSLLLCIEMAIFAVLHLFAFPWKPYGSGSGSKASDYPLTPTSGGPNDPGVKQGGLLGWRAIADAMNPWDLVKGFARGMRWLFVGRKNRENDISYKASGAHGLHDLRPAASPEPDFKRGDTLPIADEFRRSKFGLPGFDKVGDEQAGLIAHAQPHPLNNTSSGYVPARQRYDANGQDISSGARRYGSSESSPDRLHGHSPEPPRQAEFVPHGQDIGMAIGAPPEQYQSHVVQQPYPPQTRSEAYFEELREERKNRASPSQQWANSSQPNQPGVNPAHAAWGQPPPGKLQNEF